MHTPTEAECVIVSTFGSVLISTVDMSLCSIEKESFYWLYLLNGYTHIEQTRFILRKSTLERDFIDAKSRNRDYSSS